MLSLKLSGAKLVKLKVQELEFKEEIEQKFNCVKSKNVSMVFKRLVLIHLLCSTKLGKTSAMESIF